MSFCKNNQRQNSRGCRKENGSPGKIKRNTLRVYLEAQIFEKKRRKEGTADHEENQA